MKTRHQNCLQGKAGGLDWQGGFGLLAVCLGVAVIGLAVAMTRGRAAERSEDGLWEQAEQMTQRLRERGEIPARARVFRLENALLAQVLENTAGGNEKDREEKHRLLTLPMPDGSLARFRVEEASVMRPELAARFPEIKTYRGWGVDNPALTMRCDWSPEGFHAMVTDGVELMAIHPVSRDDREHYVSYAGRDYRTAAEEVRCLVNEAKVRRRITPSTAVNSSVGAQFRDYDIAIATTGEYTAAYGGMASLTTWVEGLNVIFDRELAVGFTLAVGNDQLIYTNAATDPFTNGDVDKMVNEVRGVLANAGGLGHYDLGLVLGTPTGSPNGYGSAYVGVVCETAADASGPFRGGGAVLVTDAAGNSSDLALMAHEIGHQFGATHTQNANCGARTGDTAYESGGGLTLMSNAGGCGGNDIAMGRSARFHSGSFEQIVGFLNVLGGTCATVGNSNNAPPTVNGGLDYVIPKQTPFALTATGSDVNGDTLTYCWEQADAGGMNYANPPYTDSGDLQATTRPIFRPFDPGANLALRVFPSLTYILNNQNLPPLGPATAEGLPQVGRAMNFRVTVRDGHGGVSNDSVRVDVDGSVGPFKVTQPNSALTWVGNTSVSVTWDVNGTGSGTVVNCANVKILLSLDGGNNFPHQLVASTPNTGSATVMVPFGLSSTMARVKVEAIGNIFFDISDANFTVTPGCAYSINPTSQSFTSGGGGNSVAVTATAGCQWTATSSAAWISITSGASGTGNGAVNYSVAANTGPARSGTITIAGQTFTILQSEAPNSGLQFYPLPAPVRLLETRAGFSGCTTPGAPINAGATFTLPARTGCSGVLVNAVAVTGNVTVVPAGAGFLTLFPSTTAQPIVANSNFTSGEVTNNVFTVGLGATDGAFKIFSSATTHVILEVTGYYAPPGAGGLYFHPLPTPVRLLETRAGFNGCIAPGAPLTGTGDPNSDPNLDLPVQGRSPVASPCHSIPAAAQVLVGNATSVMPSGGGYLTIYPSGGSRPTVASSNYAGNDDINGPFAVKLGADGKFKVYTISTTHLVIDILGYYSAEATDANGAGLLFNPLPTPVRLLETRPGGPPLTGCTRTNAPIVGNINAATHTQQARSFCGLPASAQAVVGNVSVVNTTGAGFLTLFPANLTTVPSVATSNYPAPATFGYNRHYFVGLSPADGTFKVLTLFTTDLILDASGYFAP